MTCCTNRGNNSYCSFTLLLYFIFALTLTTGATATASTSTTASPVLSSTLKTNDARRQGICNEVDNESISNNDGNCVDAKEREICDYISRMLSGRLIKVLNGERADTFASDHTWKKMSVGGDENSGTMVVL